MSLLKNVERVVIVAQSVATPLAEAAADVVQTSSVGTGAAPASASPSSSALEGAEMMDTAGPASDPTATAPLVPPVAPPGGGGSNEGLPKGGPSPGGPARRAPLGHLMMTWMSGRSCLPRSARSGL
ncbi:hypothetical protein MRX96_059794 [Rhipicephalus microplus]